MIDATAHHAHLLEDESLGGVIGLGGDAGDGVKLGAGLSHWSDCLAFRTNCRGMNTAMWMISCAQQLFRASKAANCGIMQQFNLPEAKADFREELESLQGFA